MPIELSVTERKVLQALSRGLQSKEIAVELQRSKATIEVYVRGLFAKFDARSRAHLVALALTSGVLRASDVVEPSSVLPVRSAASSELLSAV